MLYINKTESGCFIRVTKCLKEHWLEALQLQLQKISDSCGVNSYCNIIVSYGTLSQKPSLKRFYTMYIHYYLCVLK